MAFELIDDSAVAQIRYRTSGNVGLTENQHCKIETSPGGMEYADLVCPAGKTWAISIGITIIETDA